MGGMGGGMGGGLGGMGGGMGGMGGMMSVPAVEPHQASDGDSAGPSPTRRASEGSADPQQSSDAESAFMQKKSN